MGYWGAFLTSWQLSLFSEFFRDDTGEYLGLLFHPMTALIILGAGYVRALVLAAHWVGGSEEGDYPIRKKSIGGLSNPHADPLDPRSGMNWVGSPVKQAEQHGKHWA